jgi:hypothetical protein
MQRSCKEQLLIGEDSDCAFGDAGGDVDSQVGQLDGGRGLRWGGSDGWDGRSVAGGNFDGDVF